MLFRINFELYFKHNYYLFMTCPYLLIVICAPNKIAKRLRHGGRFFFILFEYKKYRILIFDRTGEILFYCCCLRVLH